MRTTLPALAATMSIDNLLDGSDYPVNGASELVASNVRPCRPRGVEPRQSVGASKAELAIFGLLHPASPTDQVPCTWEARGTTRVTTRRPGARVRRGGGLLALGGQAGNQATSEAPRSQLRHEARHSAAPRKQSCEDRQVRALLRREPLQATEALRRAS